MGIGAEHTIHLTFTSRAAAGTVFFFEYTFMQPNIATVDFIGGTEIAGLGTDGDQILVYQGAANSPNFIFGLSCAINDGFVLTSSGSNTSELPPALQSAGAFVEITDGLDNCQYGGARTGLPFASYAGLMETPSNWSTSDDPLTLAVSDFSN